MILIVLSLLLAAAYLISHLRISRTASSNHFGWMSAEWVAEYRAAHL